MAEEGVAKLRLKPRKAPGACSREPSPGREPPLRRQSVTDRGSWFEKEDLNECEKTWILLMKDMGQDLHCTNWKMVPSFPEFLGKSSKEESPQQEEVSTVGAKDFQWVSFPSFCEERCLNPEDLHSLQLTQSQTDPVHKGGDQADELKRFPSPAEKAGCVTVTDQAKTMVDKDTEDIVDLGASPEPCKTPPHPGSKHHLPLSQSPAKTFSFQQHCRGSVQNREIRKDERKELQIQTHQGKISLGEARCVPAEKPPPGSVPGTESCKEMENQSGGPSALDSCPMCLMQFSGTLSQLDIDGHLARCLSESADDVMWYSELFTDQAGSLLQDTVAPGTA